MTLDLLRYSESSSSYHLKVYLSKNYQAEDWSLGHLISFENTCLLSDLDSHTRGIFILHDQDMSDLESLTNYKDCYFVYPTEKTNREDHYVFYMDSEGREWANLLELFSILEIDKRNIFYEEIAREKSLYIYRKANAYMASKDKVERRTELYHRFFSSTKNLDPYEKFDVALAKCIGAFSDLKLFSFFKLVSLEEYHDISSDNKSAFLMPIDWFNNQLYCCFDVCGELEEAAFVTTLVFEALEKFSLRYDAYTNERSSTTLWEDTIETLPFPIAVVTNEGNIKLYNKNFTQLNLTPRECLALVHEDVVEIDQRYYDLSVTNIEMGHESAHLFLFHNEHELAQVSEDRGGTSAAVSSVDLGIISSSIAHELNNPLAGILAAISILELEEWDEESASVIEEMRSSAKRCKVLVEIFLSFTKDQATSSSKVTMRSVLRQALDLLRFRMIETNVRFQIEVKDTGEEFQKEMNLSLSSMFFYMILGEVLTDFNRYRVVTGKNDTNIKGVLVETKDQIKVTFDHDIVIKDFVNESKLIDYLVGAQGFSLELFDHGFSLSCWSLL